MYRSPRTITLPLTDSAVRPKCASAFLGIPDHLAKVAVLSDQTSIAYHSDMECMYSFDWMSCGFRDTAWCAAVFEDRRSGGMHRRRAQGIAMLRVAAATVLRAVEWRQQVLCAAAVAWLMLPGSARAQSSYPSRSITFIVPTSPGTVLDILARLYA